MINDLSFIIIYGGFFGKHYRLR